MNNICDNWTCGLNYDWLLNNQNMCNEYTRSFKDNNNNNEEEEDDETDSSDAIL